MSRKAPKESNETKAIAMDEYATIPDYQSIPWDFVKIPYLQGYLWRHQYQAVYSMLKAEASGPIVTESGEVFYSTSGLLPMPTGTGKTRMILGLVNFPVDERPIKHITAGTSLNLMMLNKKPRENISCSIICTKREILKDAWLKDLGISYPGLPYYEFDTVGVFEKEALRSPQYIQTIAYIDNISTFIKHWVNKVKANPSMQGEFEIQMLQIKDAEITNTDEADDYIQEKANLKKNLKEEIIRDKIVYILRTHKVLFITKDSFHFLINVFKKYTVDRVIFDEPQDITITKQDEFRDYLPDKRSEALKSVGKNVPFYEESPARFIWYVSATPYDIPNNVTAHYINGWINKNDFVINDYISHNENNRMFPELVSRYVVKFPLSYILEQKPELVKLVRKFKLKCKAKVEVAIVRGILGDDIDTMLENDDFEGAIKKLSVSGTATNILDAAIERIIFDIKKLTTKMATYDPNTPEHIIVKANDDLDALNAKLKDTQRKINRYKGFQAQDEARECPICMEDMNIQPDESVIPEKRCIAHMNCMNVFHIGCIQKSLQTCKNCPMCREEITGENIKPTYDVNGYNIEQQAFVEDQNNTGNVDVSNDIVYTSKLDAIKASLMPKIINGYNIPRRKVLLFINIKNESGTNINEIVTTIQKSGFNVRLPFVVGNADELQRAYPAIGGYRVTQKKSASNIPKEIAEFKSSHEPFVWIFRSGKESMGLNFPFVDTSISYSEFGRQVIGRSLRMDRVDPLDLITLVHADDGTEH